MSDWGRKLFEPARVAIVGATDTQGKVGRILLDNLLADFSGEIYPIHPNKSELLGLTAYPGLRATPECPDLAIIATPAQVIPQIVEEAAAAGIGVALIMTGGFAESDAAGAERQAAILEAARADGLRIVGPNCIGAINTRNGLNASFGFGLPASGGVSLVTQSGAYTMAALTLSREGRIGFAKILSLGNKADITEVDALRYLAKDPETKVIAMLLESIADGQALCQLAEEIARHKSIVVLKSARSQGGQRAAASHTAALADDSTVAVAALRQAGIHVVTDGLTLLETAAALAAQPPLAGRRVAIISNSGGTGVELTDLLEERGMTVPKLSPQLRERLASLLPALGSTANPVDVTTDWSRFAAAYGQGTALLAKSGEVDAIIPVLLQRSALMPEVTDALIEQVESCRSLSVPVHVCWVSDDRADTNRRRLMSAGIPCHEWPGRAAEVAMSCIRPTCFPAATPLEPIPDPAGAVDGQGWVTTEQARDTLIASGLPVARTRVLDAIDALEAAACELTPPWVLKVVRSDLLHKSDAGGVVLGLVDTARLEQSARQLLAQFGDCRFLLQEQKTSGVELMIGALRNASFGPLVMAGIGGIWVEALGDVIVRRAPVSNDAALSMLDELRSQALLNGVRGMPRVDRDEFAGLISTVSRFVAAAPWLQELDLNPVIANEDGLCVVDWRMRAVKAPGGDACA